MLKLIVLAAVALSPSACATTRRSGGGNDIVHINPASLANAPQQFDGRQVEVTGLLVWEFENLGLYQSYGAYCRGGEKAVIYVDWGHWPGVTKADSRRQVIVRGTFRNRVGVAQPNGSILISTGAPGPGPLEPGNIVRWLSRPAKPCPSARP